MHQSEQRIDDLYAEWGEAFRRQDVDAIAELMTPVCPRNVAAGAGGVSAGAVAGIARFRRMGGAIFDIT